jgi:GntR family transcriptional regulator of vanillate catabolism
VILIRMQSPERQVERVTLQLRRMLLAGEFEPGSRIAEIPLAGRLGVSRTPVRLALGVLEQEGLLLSSPRKGFVVREITIAEIVAAFDVRGVLEGMACRLAVERGLEVEARVVLETCLEDGERMLAKGRFDDEDPPRWSAMNARFHAALARAAHNGPLAAAIAYNGRLPMVAAGAIAFNTQGLEVSFRNMQAAQAEHRDLYEAMKTGAAARAESLAREHAYQSREKLRASLERARAGHVRADRVPGLKLVVG